MNKRTTNILVFISSALALLGSSCTYKKPARETPPPNPFRVEKSFFATRASAEYQAKTGKYWIPKRFLCGWAAEDNAGDMAQAVFDHYNFAGHCNMEFDLSYPDKLVGRRVDPSLPDQPHRWPIIITIPIKGGRHYYVEEPVDDRGRKLNKEIEQTERSTFEVRPYFDLDFAGVQILDPAIQAVPGVTLGQQADDRELDPSSNFLGFTLTATSKVWDYSIRNYASVQARLRFNFLAFASDNNFTEKKITYYHPDNAKLLNALHIIGKKPGGDEESSLLYTAKWNVEKTREIQIVGFPKEYEFIAHDTVKLWNDTFEKVTGKRPFVARTVNRKYHFDLRHTSIVWVADKRLSQSGPLGVAVVNSDVNNGEILWGNTVIWGGALERYLRAYLPPQSGGSSSGMLRQLMTSTGAPQMQLSLALPELPFNSFRRGNLPLMPSQMGGQAEAELHRIMARSLNSDFQKELLRTHDLSIEARKQKEAEFESTFNRDHIKASHLLRESTERFNNKISYQDPQSTPDQMQRLLGQPTLAQNLASLGERSEGPATPLSAMTRLQLVDEIKGRVTQRSGVQDLDRTFSESMNGWRMGMTTSGISVEKALPNVIKDVLLHEVGHMVGLGHNFKENILPKQGTVPEKYYAHLRAESERDFRNYSTVMGYKHGLTDMLMEYDELAPGPHDELVLRYIYNRQISTYSRGDEDFSFATLPANQGRIRQQYMVNGKTKKTTFFPQCNDTEATLALDPYCNRWDRGTDAKTLTQTYFDDFNATVVAQLQSYSSSIRRPDARWVEYLTWMRSFNTFGRTRLFYDHMRQTYDGFLRRHVFRPGKDGEKNLLDFSEACAVANGELSENRKVDKNHFLVTLLNAPENAELKDLCQAINISFREMQKVLRLSGSDFTEFDRQNRHVVSSMTGGDTSLGYENVFGTWREMARIPLKISGLYATLLPYPTQMYSGWLVPVGLYSGGDGYFHISTMYPREYTQLVSAVVDSNVKIGSMSQDQSTRMGRAVLALGQLLPYSHYTNDRFVTESNYREVISKQTEFNYNYAVIEITRVEENGKHIAREFTAKMFNLFSGRNAEDLTDIYLYPNKKVIARPPAGSLIYPLSEIRWYSANTGYYYAIRVDYPLNDPADTLKTNSVKNAIEDTYNYVLRLCVEGTQGETPAENGLRYFFNRGNDKIFPGFTFSLNIHQNPNDQNTLFESINEQFKKYWSNNYEGSFKVAPDPRACSEALKGQGLLVTTAAALNGIFLNEIIEYMELGQ